MKKARRRTPPLEINLNPSNENELLSEILSTKKAYKTLRYVVPDSGQMAVLTQLTQRMVLLGILDKSQPGMAGKVLMEIVLRKIVGIDEEVLKEYKRIKSKK